MKRPPPPPTTTPCDIEGTVYILMTAVRGTCVSVSLEDLERHMIFTRVIPLAETLYLYPYGPFRNTLQIPMTPPKGRYSCNHNRRPYISIPMTHSRDPRYPDNILERDPMSPIIPLKALQRFQEPLLREPYRSP